MFEKFGEFNSVEELNKAAEGLKAEGDSEGLSILAEENGIDHGDAADYWNGDMKALTTLTTAAMGRVAIQKKESKIPEYARDVIYGMAETLCAQRDEPVETLVMKKGARIDSIWKAMEDMARKNRKGNMGVACGTDADLRRMVISALGGNGHETC